MRRASTYSSTTGVRTGAPMRREWSKSASAGAEPAAQQVAQDSDLAHGDVLVLGVRERTGRPGRSSAPGCRARRSGRRRSSRTSGERLPHRGRRTPPRRADRARAARRGRGRRPSTSKPSNTSRTCATASSTDAVRREAVVDRHHALVGDDVAGDAAADPHGIESLAVLQPVDDRSARLVGGQSIEDRRRQRGSRCRPATSARCAPDVPVVAHLDPQRALAARLDAGVRRLHQDGEVGLQQSGRASARRCSPLNCDSTSSHS